jgi:hypothetical protein
VKEFDHLDAQDWVSSFEKSASRKASGPKESPVEASKAWASEFVASPRQTAQAASDTLERDVQAFQVHQARRPQNPLSTPGTLRAVAILRHLVTPVSPEERVQQAFEARRAKYPHINRPGIKAAL